MSDVQEAVSTAGPYGIAGAITFAAIKLGPPLKTLIELLYAIWEQREIRIEQEERRARKRRRGDSSLPPMRLSKGDDNVPEFVREEDTGLVVVREDVRKRAPRGFRAPTRGEHHDKE
jgi:hypothetical protein